MVTHYIQYKNKEIMVQMMINIPENCKIRCGF